jgi:hypothetical protein
MKSGVDAVFPMMRPAPTIVEVADCIRPTIAARCWRHKLRPLAVGQVTDRREDDAGQYHHNTGKADREALLELSEAQQHPLL